MKVYETRYHGHRPYCVEVSEQLIEVFEQSWDETNEYWSKDRRVYQSSYERIFIGDNLNQDPNAFPKGLYPGNTFLIHLRESEYVFIGHVIFSFSSIEGYDILHYISPLSRTDEIPEPQAIGNQCIYDLNHRICLVMANDESSTKIPFIAKIIHSWVPIANHSEARLKIDGSSVPLE